ncbi:MAG: hypothetical protein ACKVQB_07820 [Bacteroidia bacterium]
MIKQKDLLNDTMKKPMELFKPSDFCGRTSKDIKFDFIFLRFLGASFLKLAVCSILFFSCEEPKDSITVITDPEFQSIEINANQFATHYYSLGQKKTISSNKITDWDLRFCAQNDKYYIYLNTTKNMRIARYDGNFSDTIAAADIKNWQLDIMKSGKCMSAMGNWGDFSFSNPKSFGYTYIIDMGYINFVNEFGYLKIEVLGFTNGHYTLKFGLLNDPNGDTIAIEKKNEFDYMYLQLLPKAKVVNIEPPSSQWDLVFTQYGLSSQVIKNGTIVDTGFTWTDMILLNSNGRTIAVDTLKEFDKITFWDAEKYIYDNAIDYIGNKWRFFNFQNKAYEVTKKNIYVVKKSDNRIYKIELKSVDKSIPGITKIGFKVKNL